jgi:diguanylate cyclase
MLKIDRSFVRELTESEHSRKLVASIVQIAHTLGLEPLAEGVETEDQRRFLVERGCRYGQGFLFSRPLPRDQVKAFYDREQRTNRRVA